MTDQPTPSMITSDTEYRVTYRTSNGRWAECTRVSTQREAQAYIDGGVISGNSADDYRIEARNVTYGDWTV